MKERDDAQQGHYLKEEYYIIIHLKSALHCAFAYLVLYILVRVDTNIGCHCFMNT